jgi:metal-responsive CopG/Arc/MetJ family transcriptional regulator
VDLKTVRITLEAGLIEQVDRASGKLGLSRSAFTRRALSAALEQLRIQALERRHRYGYRRKPVRRKEFDVWAHEQIWSD